MSILEEAMQKPKVEDFSTEEVLTETGQGQVSFDFWAFLKTPTGPGGIDEYKDSPLNFDRTEGLARILRGLAGILGADILRLAVVDIIFGLLQWVKSGRVESA